MLLAPMIVPSEDEYLTKYSSDILLTISGYEPPIDLPQRLSKDSLRGVSLSPREIYTYVEEYPTSSIY